MYATDGAIKFVSVRSYFGNLRLSEITKGFNFIIPKILDELLTRSVFRHTPLCSEYTK